MRGQLSTVCVEVSHAYSDVTCCSVGDRVAGLRPDGDDIGATPQSTSAARPHTTSTTKLITPLTVVAPRLSAAGIETCLGSASDGLSLMGAGLTLGGTTRRRMQHP